MSASWLYYIHRIYNIWMGVGFASQHRPPRLRELHAKHLPYPTDRPCPSHHGHQRRESESEATPHARQIAEPCACALRLTCCKVRLPTGGMPVECNRLGSHYQACVMISIGLSSSSKGSHHPCRWAGTLLHQSNGRGEREERWRAAANARTRAILGLLIVQETLIFVSLLAHPCFTSSMPLPAMRSSCFGYQQVRYFISGCRE